MALASEDGTAHGRGARARPGDGGLDTDWADPGRPHRDWKKLALVVGLGVLSWVATYVGMLELIEANMGDLPLIHKLIIGFSVAMLMTMIVWLLDQLFAPIGLFTKLIYAAGYIFLTIISVGFGFGFYWKVLESRSESSRSAESAVSQVQGSLHAASTRLEQLQATLVQLTQVSQQKAETERASGTSCPNSRPGDGPRRKMREDDAARFGFASEFVKGRVGAVKTDLTALDAEFVKIAKDDKGTVDAKTGTRNEFMKALSRKLDMTVTGFNAFRTDPQLKQIRTDLAERAEKVAFLDTKGATYACPDPQLQTALRGVVRAIDQLPEMEKPKIAAVEGSEATIEAFRRLTATFYGMLSFKMPPSADELRALQQKAVQSVEGGPSPARMAAMAEQAGLSKRDYVPLAIAIFVDICLLLVSMGRPVNRLGNLVPKMREAEQGPVYQILSKFSDIHKDQETREKFEIFRHVVFDFNGDYYVAVPLNAPVRANPQQKLDLQLEAHLLANLFSSFEKERIFSRVHSPFLTTRTIQKKLWRQGSKFAGSEAFRIYRFRDGAWSEIILGAVMGAARRVDAEKRRRVLEDGHRLPTPDIAPQHSGTPGYGPAQGAREDTPSFGHYGQWNDRATGASATVGQNRSGYAFGHVAGADGMTRTGTGRSSPRPAAAAGSRRPPAEFHDAATLAEKFGPYAGTVVAGPAIQRPAGERFAPSANYRETAAALNSVGAARQDVPEAEVSVRAAVRAANNNTAPPGMAEPILPISQVADLAAVSEAVAAAVQQVSGAAREAVASPITDNVVPLPRVIAPRSGDDMMAGTEVAGSTTGPTIDVTVRRETATFSVPVSEARLPQSLERLFAKSVVAGRAGRQSEAASGARLEVVEAEMEAGAPVPAHVLAVLPPVEAEAQIEDTPTESLPALRFSGVPAE
jgi:hypothetical protein